MKWKIGQLYPIPKSEDWNYNLANIRLIILLEIFYKNVVRIIKQRLDLILVDYKVLEDSNYTDLSGNSISSSIHSMNNLLENIRQKDKEV